MRKVIKKSLKEISEELVQIVNNESTNYDAVEKVLEHLAYNLHMSEDYKINLDIEVKNS
jgi:predicted hydrocarbon binding protein